PTAACIPILLIPMTIAFYTYCQKTFERRTLLVPLDQLPVETFQGPQIHQGKYKGSSEPDLRSQKQSHATFSNPFLDTISSDVEESDPGSPVSPALTAGATSPARLLPQGRRTRKRSQRPQGSSVENINAAADLRITTSPGVWASTGDEVGRRVVGSSNGDIANDADDIEPDVVLSAEEHQSERYPVSYLNPLYSKPLSRPWLPLAIAGCWALLPRYDSDGMIHVDEEATNIVPSASEPQKNTITVGIDSEKSATVDDISRRDFKSASVELHGASVSEMGPKSKSDLASNPRLAAIKSNTRNRRGSLSKGVFVVATAEEAAGSQDEIDFAISSDGKLATWTGSHDGSPSNPFTEEEV
ncbi:hypothetical protein HDU76_007329, partial [Blyttiomyces sp. JEL0837]